MSKEQKDRQEDLDDILGLNEDDTSSNEDENIEDVSTDDTKDTTETKKTTETKDENITLTPAQVEISNEITKIDVKLEELKAHEVSEDEFYKTLDDNLSEEEARLQFNDKTAYYKLVNKKLNEYIDSNSKKDEIKELEDSKSYLQEQNEIQASVNQVAQKYPDYDHKAMIEFFKNELPKKAQDEIFASSTTFSDVYEATYKKFKEINPTTIKSEQTPNIPNVNNSRRQDVNPNKLKDGFKSEDEELQEALGL